MTLDEVTAPGRIAAPAGQDGTRRRGGLHQVGTAAEVVAEAKPSGSLDATAWRKRSAKQAKINQQKRDATAAYNKRMAALRTRSAKL